MIAANSTQQNQLISTILSLDTQAIFTKVSLFVLGFCNIATV